MCSGAGLVTARIAALAGLLAVSCGPSPTATTRAPVLRAPAAFDAAAVGLADLSADGTTLALMGLATGPGPVEDRTALWLIDVDTRQVIGRTPIGHVWGNLKWGPGGSFVVLVLAPEDQRGLWWARSPRGPLVSIYGTIAGAPLRPNRGIVDPTGKWAVVSAPQPRSSESRTWGHNIYSLSLCGDRTARQMDEGFRFASLAGLVEKRDGEGPPLALVTGVPLNSDAFTMALIDCASGDIVKSIDLDLGITLSDAGSTLEYQTGEMLLPLIPVDGGRLCAFTLILKVDLRQGVAELFATIPERYRFLKTVETPQGRRTFFGGWRNVWEIRDSAHRRSTEVVVFGGGHAFPAGVRRGPNGTEVLFAVSGPGAVWRCVLESKRTEVIMGQPDDRYAPPRIAD